MGDELDGVFFIVVVFEFEGELKFADINDDGEVLVGFDKNADLFEGDDLEEQALTVNDNVLVSDVHVALLLAVLYFSAKLRLGGNDWVVHDDVQFRLYF